MRWRLSNRADPAANVLAKRHYSCQSPESDQFVAPGCPVVLLTPAADALWVSLRQRFVDHAWPGAWVCSLFRNEGPYLSSELIREAVAATLWAWGSPPHEGVITFVDPNQVRHKRDPGRCFLRAGFFPIGTTRKRRRLVFQLLPAAMPTEAAPLDAQPWLFAARPP